VCVYNIHTDTARLPSLAIFTPPPATPPTQLHTYSVYGTMSVSMCSRLPSVAVDDDDDNGVDNASSVRDTASSAEHRLPSLATTTVFTYTP